MKTLFQSVTVYDPNSPWHGKTVDILQDNNQTRFEISGTHTDADLVVPPSQYYVTPGWIDALAFCGEPGEEWREDLESLSNAGSQGGFTHIAAVCGNHPLPHSATAIQSIVAKSASFSSRIMPIGLASKDGKGQELSELFEMKRFGAVAFTELDATEPDSGQKARVLEYAYNCNAPVLVFPFKCNLAHNGMMHEGTVSAGLGLKGIPAVSEEIALQEYISLCKWLKLPLRISKISTAGSVELIARAINEGLDVKALVPVMNLLFTDDHLSQFDENYKVLPPLRTDADKNALLSALKSGVISGVCSNHNPQDIENKSVEFDYAAFGASTIETAFAQLCTALGDDTTPELIYKSLVAGPAEMLNMKQNALQDGENVSYTIFSLSEPTVVQKKSSKSKGVNNPCMGMNLRGRVVATVSEGKSHVFSQAAVI